MATGIKTLIDHLKLTADETGDIKSFYFGIEEKPRWENFDYPALIVNIPASRRSAQSLHSGSKVKNETFDVLIALVDDYIEDSRSLQEQFDELETKLSDYISAVLALTTGNAPSVVVEQNDIEIDRLAIYGNDMLLFVSYFARLRVSYC